MLRPIHSVHEVPLFAFPAKAGIYIGDGHRRSPVWQDFSMTDREVPVVVLDPVR
jgi:hypothetical protein